MDQDNLTEDIHEGEDTHVVGTLQEGIHPWEDIQLEERGHEDNRVEDILVEGIRVEDMLEGKLHAVDNVLLQPHMLQD